MHNAITDLYLIWSLRYERYMSPLQDITMNMVAPERALTKDSQEILESNGYIFVKSDNTLSSRFTVIRFMVEIGGKRDEWPERNGES